MLYKFRITVIYPFSPEIFTLILLRTCYTAVRIHRMLIISTVDLMLKTKVLGSSAIFAYAFMLCYRTQVPPCKRWGPVCCAGRYESGRRGNGQSRVSNPGPLAP